MKDDDIRVPVGDTGENIEKVALEVVVLDSQGEEVAVDATEAPLKTL